jgi:hypothetical protein
MAISMITPEIGPVKKERIFNIDNIGFLTPNGCELICVATHMD